MIQMRSFDYDDDDFKEEEMDEMQYADDDDDDDDDEYIEIEAARIGLIQMELKHRILEKAIEICSKTIFWRFRNLQYKLNKIEACCEMLNKILEKN